MILTRSPGQINSTRLLRLPPLHKFHLLAQKDIHHFQLSNHLRLNLKFKSSTNPFASNVANNAVNKIFNWAVAWLWDWR